MREVTRLSEPHAASLLSMGRNRVAPIGLLSAPRQLASREERTRLVIDTPLAVAELCAEMPFLSHESLRVILLNTKQELIKVVSVSQGTLNEALLTPVKFLNR